MPGEDRISAEDLLAQSEVRLARLRAELRRAEAALRAEEELWDELRAALADAGEAPAERRSPAPIVAIGRDETAFGRHVTIAGIGRDESVGPGSRPIAVIGREEPATAPTTLRLERGEQCPCGTCREGRDEDAGIGPGLVRPD